MSLDGPLVIALGGNAVVRDGDDGTVATQYVRARSALAEVAELICAGRRVVLTHGNGPIVGAIAMRGDLASPMVPPTPLFIADADSEGGIGLMLQQVLGNLLVERRCERHVATIVTQVIVDRHDPAFADPTKPIGPTFTSPQLAPRAGVSDYRIREVRPGTWQRVVASPLPHEIVEADAIAALVAAGVTPIAAGGGGVPVTADETGHLIGCDAVVDKDWSSAVLAHQLSASLLVILMDADAVYDGWGTPDARRVQRMTSAQALKRSMSAAAGSLRPKLAAAAWFAARGGCTVIGSADDVAGVVSQRTGTVVCDRQSA